MPGILQDAGGPNGEDTTSSNYDSINQLILKLINKNKDKASPMI